MNKKRGHVFKWILPKLFEYTTWWRYGTILNWNEKAIKKIHIDRLVEQAIKENEGFLDLSIDEKQTIVDKLSKDKCPDIDTIETEGVMKKII